MDGGGQKGSTEKEMGSSADHSVDLRSELEDRESESDWRKEYQGKTQLDIYTNSSTPKLRNADPEPKTQNPEPRESYTPPQPTRDAAPPSNHGAGEFEQHRS